MIGDSPHEKDSVSMLTPKSPTKLKNESSFKKYEKSDSIKSGVSPMKQLVKNEIKRQSVLLVKNMSIIERHSILINPRD